MSGSTPKEMSSHFYDSQKKKRYQTSHLTEWICCSDACQTNEFESGKLNKFIFFIVIQSWRRKTHWHFFSHWSREIPFSLIALAAVIVRVLRRQIHCWVDVIAVIARQFSQSSQCFPSREWGRENCFDFHFPMAMECGFSLWNFHRLVVIISAPFFYVIVQNCRRYFFFWWKGKIIRLIYDFHLIKILSNCLRLFLLVFLLVFTATSNKMLFLRLILSHTNQPKNEMKSVLLCQIFQSTWLLYPWQQDNFNFHREKASFFKATKYSLCRIFPPLSTHYTFKYSPRNEMRIGKFGIRNFPFLSSAKQHTLLLRIGIRKMEFFSLINKVISWCEKRKKKIDDASSVMLCLRHKSSSEFRS